MKLLIVDINPKDFFRKSRLSIYRGASGLLIAFDKDNSSSFEAVKYWLQEFRKYISSPVPICLVGLITPAEKILSEQGRELAVELKASYYETTVDDSQFIEHIFRDLTLEIIRKKSE